jgi:hypothetical protein
MKVITVVSAAPWEAVGVCQNDRIKVVTAAAKAPTLTLAVGAQLVSAVEVGSTGICKVLVVISVILLRTGRFQKARNLACLLMHKRKAPLITFVLPKL